mmetsp:Transcript_8324/g.9093  ORF Transcript_8324/g.9093 Transcript_8324/m.9093 type:complete len:205 (+) Transcript_8324:230-844(+)
MKNRHGLGDKYDRMLNLLLIGDSGVGKSCLLLRYSDDSYTASFITTIGIDFKIKVVQCGDEVIRLHLWDTAGQERFKTITTAYYRGANGILLVYDVSDEVSFSNVRNWMKQINQNAPTDVNIVLIGNKCDVDPSERKVPFEKGKELADEYDIKFFETSAKLNINVNECFLDITKDILERGKQGGRFGAVVNLGGIQTETRNSCC